MKKITFLIFTLLVTVVLRANANPNNLIATEVGSKSAVLSWQKTQIGVSEYYVSTFNIAPNSKTIASGCVTGNSVVLSSLSPETKYYAWVRSQNANPITNSWSTVTTFTTDCEAVSSFDENFETTVFPNIPLCWNKILNMAAPGSDIFVSAYSSVSLPNDVTLFGGNSSVSAGIILVSPQVTSITNGYHLTFAATGNVPLQVGTLDSNFDTATFTLKQEVTPNDFNATIYNIDFSDYTGTDTYLAFRLKTGSTTTSSQYVAIDDVLWENNLKNNEFNSSNFSYYPNPITNVLNLSYIENIRTVSVINLLGQTVLTKNVENATTQVDLSALANGTYIVKVFCTDKTNTIKVVKE